MKSLVAEAIAKAKNGKHANTGIESWIDKRLRLGLPINTAENLIRINAQALLTMHNYKMELLGSRKTLAEESEEAEERRKAQLAE